MPKSELYQEKTSVYFSNIIRRDITPLTVEQLPDEVIDDFNEQMRNAFPEEGDKAVRRVRYLIPYILQAIDWDEYNMPLQAWQLQYYYQRKRFVEKTRFDYAEFLSHEPLQKSLRSLELDAEQTFEFILFLKYYFGLRSELRYSPIEQIERATEAINNLGKNKTASIDINIGGKHYKIADTKFIKDMLTSIDKKKLSYGDFVNSFNEGSARDKIRAIDYFMVKTLLDYLPIKTKHERQGKFTQEERDFGLSVLNYCGRLPDIDREEVCSRENNVTFDNLMRTFEGTPIPFAMEFFL